MPQGLAGRKIGQSIAVIGDLADTSRRPAGAIPERTLRGPESMNRFLRALKSRLAGARAVQAELDRRLAARFNVFDHFHTDELGRSRVIADLLDPQAAHGQGTLFLGGCYGWSDDLPASGGARDGT